MRTAWTLLAICSRVHNPFPPIPQPTPHNTRLHHPSHPSQKPYAHIPSILAPLPLFPSSDPSSEENDEMFPLPSTTSLSALSTLPTSSTDPEPTAEEPPLGLPTQITTNGQLKKVKVYELRNDAWFDRGTGHVHGLYDEGTDQALLVVTAEEVLDKSVKARIEKEKEEARLAKKEESSEQEAEPGGFVLDEEDAEKDEEGSWGDPKALKALRAKGIEGRLIMHTFIQGRDAYSRQQGECFSSPDGFL